LPVGTQILPVGLEVSPVSLEILLVGMHVRLVVLDVALITRAIAIVLARSIVLARGGTWYVIVGVGLRDRRSENRSNGNCK
jgi:hypothetical protein